MGPRGRQRPGQPLEPDAGAIIERGAPTRAAFALLLVAQTAHSVEEYVARLFDIFPPARFVSRLFSDDLSTGFIIANALLIGAAIWCLALPISRGWPSSVWLGWFWAGLEIVNGTVHSILALLRHGYFPGVLTAPLLIAAGVWLSKCLMTRASGRVTTA